MVIETETNRDWARDVETEALLRVSLISAFQFTLPSLYIKLTCEPLNGTTCMHIVTTPNSGPQPPPPQNQVFGGWWYVVLVVRL